MGARTLDRKTKEVLKKNKEIQLICSIVPVSAEQLTQLYTRIHSFLYFFPIMVYPRRWAIPPHAIQ